MPHTARLADKQKVGNPTSPRYAFAPPWESAQCREGRNRAARKPYASNAAGLYPIARALSGIAPPYILRGRRAARHARPGTRCPRPKRRPSEPGCATPRAMVAVAAPASIAPPAIPGPVPIAGARGRAARASSAAPRLWATGAGVPSGPETGTPRSGAPRLPQGHAAAPVIRQPLTPNGNATRQPMAGALPFPAGGVRSPRPPPSPDPTVPVPFPVAVQSGQGPSLRPLPSAFVSGFRGPRCSWAASSPGANGSRGQPPPEATVPVRRAFPDAGASVTRDLAASSTARAPDLRPGNTTRTA